MVAPPSAGTEATRRALVVDDELVVGDLIADILAQEGWSVQRVQSGEAGLEVLKQGPCDLIVLDLKMPGMSGQEFYAHLERRHPELVHRVVVCTGSFLDEADFRFLHQSGAQVVHKPFTLEQLWAAVHQVLNAA
ncbi:MAG: response regulator [Deinococcus sp.]|nr:response regulator [Deinococcus sp.]